MMDIEAAEIELCLRKYQWALKDFQREYEGGYTLLRSLPLPNIQRFLIYVNQLPASEQVELVRAIVKGSHQSALVLMGEKLTEEDKARTNACVAEMRSMAFPVVSNNPVTKTFAVKRADVAKTVLPVLSSAFGAKPQKFASLQWFYITPIGHWRFYTELDFSGTWGTEIRCHHRLVCNDGKSRGFMPMIVQTTAEPIQIWQAFSLASLYGLSGDTYYIHSSEDVQDATRSILVGRDHLFRAVPNWVNQLTVQD